MRTITILLIILSSSLYSYEFKLNKNDIKIIKESPAKKFIINRLKKYKYLKESLQTKSLKKKLIQTNGFINKILPANDSKKTQFSDYWSTPKEFLINGYGDCEDYAIAKYFTLIELGINKKNLYFADVKVKGSRTAHMVLLYKKQKQKQPLVLDNLSFRILPLAKRKDLTPRFAFNEYKSYILNKKGFTQRIRINWGKSNKWENLLNKVYKEKK